MEEVCFVSWARSVEQNGRNIPKHKGTRIPFSVIVKN